MARPFCSVSRMCDMNDQVVLDLRGEYHQSLVIGQKTQFTKQNIVYVKRMCVEEIEGA